jgi:F0F1-type ATP synthase membrane subunit b/b'
MGLFKTIGVVGGVAGVLLSASVAFAEDSGGRVITATATTTKNVRAETAREETKTRIETAREEAKTRIEKAREEAKTRMETKREKAKERINDIRDKAKQQLAEKLANQFEELNKKWTDNCIKQLDHYSAVLLKIQERADIASTNGKDTTATNIGITSAKTAIETARTAVVAQAAKSYVLDTSTLTTTVATTTDSGQDKLVKNIRNAFQDLHKSLFSDLKALRDGVMKDARTAVQSALQTLSKIPKVDDNSDDN